jgi:hypothetical protein
MRGLKAWPALALLLLLFAPPAKAADVRLEALTGATFRAQPLHDTADAELELGLRAHRPLHRFGDLPLALSLEAGWSFGGSAQGTRGVQVDRTIHVGQLAGNLEFFVFEGGGWLLSNYIGGGPAVVHSGVDYELADPVAGGREVRTVGEWRAAGLMQLGATFAKEGWLPLPLVARLEARMLFRSGVVDTTVFGGLGVAFAGP